MSGYACPQCYQPTLRFIHEYQQWWCDSCQRYTPPAQPGQPAQAAQPSYQQPYAPAYQEPYQQPAYAPPTSPPVGQPAPPKRDPIKEALAKTKEGFDKMADYPRRERELRVKGFTHDEIQLILRHGYTEQQVLDMRPKTKTEAVPAPAPQVVVVQQAPTPVPAQPQTTIIVKGDYVPSKSESKVEIRDSVVNRANISGAEPGGAVVEDSVVTRSKGLDGGSHAKSAPATPASSSSCPNCKSPSQPGWKACPSCGLRLG
jgi:hypothetical protein